MTRVRSVIATVLIAVCATALPAFAQAVSPIEYASNSIADARLGVAIATLGELADTPELLARPSSQQFADATFAQIASVNDIALRSHAERRRDTLRVDAPATFDRDAAYAALGDLTKDVLHAVGGARSQFLTFGIIAEQTEYNARVLHDFGADGENRKSIASDAVADQFVPGLAALRAQLGSSVAHTWSDTADVSEKIVAALLGSDFATPFPRSPAVWVVLLRTRGTPADARRHAPHYWIDIVHYDGRHRTIGAYPDGGLAFDRDTAHLECGLDLETNVASLRTVPIPPGPGSSSAQLADGLLKSCANAGTEGLKYHVASADDDRFVSDILYRNGVAVGPVLRAVMSR